MFSPTRAQRQADYRDAELSGGDQMLAGRRILEPAAHDPGRRAVFLTSTSQAALREETAANSTPVKKALSAISKKIRRIFPRLISGRIRPEGGIGVFLFSLDCGVSHRNQEKTKNANPPPHYLFRITAAP